VALSERDRAVLDLEGERFVSAGAKVAAIRDRFGLSATAYYQPVNELIDTVEALKYAPVTFYRLRRLREARSAHRRADAGS
jgi:hypothetical protein